MANEFGAAKRKAILGNRGLDILRADEVFAATRLTVDDGGQDYGEDRFITIWFLDGRMVILVWTPRGNTTRIISMEKGNERGQVLYRTRF